MPANLLTKSTQKLALLCSHRYFQSLDLSVQVNHLWGVHWQREQTWHFWISLSSLDRTTWRSLAARRRHSTSSSIWSMKPHLECYWKTSHRQLHKLSISLRTVCHQHKYLHWNVPRILARSACWTWVERTPATCHPVFSLRKSRNTMINQPHYSHT